MPRGQIIRLSQYNLFPPVDVDAVAWSDDFRFGAADYEDFVATAPFKDFDVIKVRLDGEVKKAVIVDCHYKMDSSGFLVRVYKAATLNKNGQWSRRWTKVFPVEIYKGYGVKH